MLLSFAFWAVKKQQAYKADILLWDNHRNTATRPAGGAGGVR